MTNMQTFTARRTFLAASLAGLYGARTLCAADPPVPLRREVREFEVWVKQSKAGFTKLTIEEFPENRSTVTTSADVVVSFFGIKYVYRVEAAEQWHGETLERLESQTVDGSAKIAVAVEKAGDAWNVTIDQGKPRRETTLNWTTGFLTPPEALAEKGGAFIAIDVDTGKRHDLKLAHVGREAIDIADRREDCEHYKVSGTLEVDLWYDAAGRLAKRKSVESGYVTELRLVDLRREKPRK